MHMIIAPSALSRDQLNEIREAHRNGSKLPYDAQCIMTEAPQTQTVYVVMSNDFPDSVFATHDAALNYVNERTAQELELIKLPIWERPRGRIYWTMHKFEVRDV